MTNLPNDYDRMILRGPEERNEVGVEEGDECNRVAEPDEDAPKNHRPRPCEGTIVLDHGVLICDCCQELV